MTGETLLRVLDESVRRHGEDKPLTIGHLRNIVRLALRAEANREDRAHRAAMDALDEDKKWGSS